MIINQFFLSFGVSISNLNRIMFLSKTIKLFSLFFFSFRCFCSIVVLPTQNSKNNQRKLTALYAKELNKMKQQPNLNSSIYFKFNLYKFSLVQYQKVGLIVNWKRMYRSFEAQTRNKEIYYTQTYRNINRKLMKVFLSYWCMHLCMC